MIEKQTDPRTRKQLLFAVGKVEGVYFNELKNVKTYSGPRGPWTPTHAVNLIIDGARVGLGLTDKDAINCKDVDGNYHVLAKGMEVSAEVEEAGEYKGVMQYNSKASLITILDASVPAPANTPQGASGSPSGQQYGGGRDDTQVVAGNARTAAYAFLKGKPYKDITSFKKIVKSMAEIGFKAREQYSEENPDLSKSQIGLSVGQALVLAAGMAKNAKEVEIYLWECLEEIVPFSVDVVKNLNTPAEEEDVPEEEEADASETEEEYFDDDVPF